MIYLYDNAIVDDLNRSFNPTDGGESPVVRVIDPEHIVGLAAQIQNDEISLPLVALERNDYTIDSDRTNFTMMHKGNDVVIDNKTNEIYQERVIPIKLSYTLTALTSNQIDMDELIKELIFKYTDMYYLTIRSPYECNRKFRFGVRIERDAIEKRSGASDYIESGQLYQASIPMICDGAVMLHYTPYHLKRVKHEIVAE
jgi:hypothetical protein